MTKHCMHPKVWDDACWYCKLNYMFITLNKEVDEDDMPAFLYGFMKDNGKCYGMPCYSCGGKNEGYMLKNHIWRKAARKGDRHLCIGCVENRIGRPLKLEDFSTAMINFGVLSGFDCRYYVKVTGKTA